MTRKLLSKNKTRQLRKLSSGLLVMGPFAQHQTARDLRLGVPCGQPAQAAPLQVQLIRGHRHESRRGPPASINHPGPTMPAALVHHAIPPGWRSAARTESPPSQDKGIERYRWLIYSSSVSNPGHSGDEAPAVSWTPRTTQPQSRRTLGLGLRVLPFKVRQLPER